MCAVDKLVTSGDQAFMNLFGLRQQTPIGTRDEFHYPMRPRPIIRVEEHSGHYLSAANWGLVPFWAKDVTIGRSAFNARSDSIAENKPMFRAAFKYRRCLLIATSYIEYRTEEGKKVPYEFTVDGKMPYAYAGLWESWGEDLGAFESCTMITTEPNELAARVHNRMPVILDQTDYDLWLDPKAERNDLLNLLIPFDARRMEANKTVIHRKKLASANNG